MRAGRGQHLCNPNELPDRCQRLAMQQPPPFPSPSGPLWWPAETRWCSFITSPHFSFPSFLLHPSRHLPAHGQTPPTSCEGTRAGGRRRGRRKLWEAQRNRPSELPLSCDLNSNGANCERRERQQRAANATCWQQEPAELHPEQGRGSRG